MLPPGQDLFCVVLSASSSGLTFHLGQAAHIQRIGYGKAEKVKYFCIKEIFQMKRCFVVLLLLLCLFLAACGGTATVPVPTSTTANQQSTSGPAGTTPASDSSPTILRVTRTDPSVTNNIGPLNKAVTSASTVQSLYSMALKLPVYPTGTSISQSCLNDLGVIYHLDFLQGTTDVQRMNLDPGNCKILYFSQTDLRQASDSFLNLLKQAIQVHSLTSN
jgi:hypothetical protein